MAANILTLVVNNASSTGPGIGFITAAGFNTTPDIVVTSSTFIPPPLSAGWMYASYDAGMGSMEHRISVLGVRPSNAI